ncbi:hypothetical protein A2833_00075 [Candidatus Azambacteria bacterium RIFCSPHIGHO2_01_FULL_44_55]|uniref:Uncharacterized protein n=1 Tax=Candidatus Azambacteria bacterium RIFCSPLOWO2_02_FULL_44_14 TaxID=1797306 RepID=A0A1F5CBS8_9BACT|nr:MAG: hypothetical protein A3A18_01390 [Candidatus Azambacteria bacterium RIFCSPLOWO2_01_FULL_44_84]OGD33181.1 MAG: hypothetical protein A3C78_02890 [Candidatus Azambacteria bacterium RIFCSPHIGHO2_02_FULL_45_18]OGD40253.1 MAG: hypothetical protein A2833_00075 [Candidatus Azambacteria bacterium RIFCSPHIGHO2_01_FULL_44_55]OGD40286.1 MAG: hypothetical protein A3I30_03250 [Candidatus Azambacteria bacterium RIFCSPLOWO2_02_FULL_44_14]OGD51013.1 MAG: hypothetical protein A2608_03200 [Candidatus Azam
MALTTKHQVLAWDLVEGLQDEAHKGVYFRLAKTYDETFLRGILSMTRDAWHGGKIKKEDMGRYFMGILKKELVKTKQYVENSKNRPRGRTGSKGKIKTGGRPQVAGN